MLKQKTLDNRIEKAMDLTSDLKQTVMEYIIMEHTDASKVRILIGNYEMMLKHILLGYRDTTKL